LDLDVIGGGFQAVLVILSAIIFGALALKSKSVKSFSFQFSIFMLLWAAAELPAALSTMGVIVDTSYQNLGLEVHLFSMFVFGGFVLLRGRSIFGEMHLSQLVEKATYSSVSKAIDPAGAKALGFYVDYGLAGRDPNRFDTMLRKVFASGSEVIENNIVDELYRTSGVQREPGDSDFVSTVTRVTAAAKKV
jgi:hypothetical protein